MNTKLITLTLTVAVGLTTSLAQAVPIKGIFVDDPLLCDNPPTMLLSHELGDAAIFPPSEALLINIASTNQTCCTGNDGFPNDFEITITNITPFRWQDLHFVVDPAVSIGNVDGDIEDLTFPGFHNAFRIDNVGINNNNLIAGDANNNLVFDIGEAWTFLVTNFVAPASLPPFPFFGSPGIFAASSANANSNASILANLVVPEPGACALFALSLVCFTARRHRTT